MSKYREKPVTIEAFRYDGDLKNRDGEYYVPDWAVEAYNAGIMYYHPQTEGELFIHQLIGDQSVGIGDYIIRSAQGIFSCKHDIFEETYELME